MAVMFWTRFMQRLLSCRFDLSLLSRERAVSPDEDPEIPSGSSAQELNRKPLQGWSSRGLCTVERQKLGAQYERVRYSAIESIVSTLSRGGVGNRRKL
jgi:hypothetical protein